MKQIIFILLVAILSCPLNMQSQGLTFKGNESPIGKRTSYTVFNHSYPVFKDSLAINFDCAVSELPQAGYIFRLELQRSPDLIYNLAYDSYGEKLIYRLNEEGKDILITKILNRQKRNSNNWLHIELKINLITGLTICAVGDDKHIFDIGKVPNPVTPEIYFGKSDYFIELPTFSIRNLKVSDSKKEFEFLFQENQDTIVHDSNGAARGSVINPIWLINKSYYWDCVATYKSESVAAYNFDTFNQHIYYCNRDSITTYNILNNTTTKDGYKNDCPIHSRLGSNFVNTIKNSLYLYEVSSPLDGGDVTIAEYSITDKKWVIVSKDKLERQLHHHGKFLDAANNRFIIFGGFGDLRYNNQFYCFDLNTNKWEKLTFTGDTIFPRYFLSMGYDKASNCLYVFGGMGNESGKSTVGRKYFYDLYKVDLNSMRITKQWEIPWTEENKVPVKSMIIKDGYFTTLCYSEHLSNSYLRLYRFSLADGRHEIFGDSIPIRSEKITTNADLFYDNDMNEYYGIVQEFGDNDISSTLKIYSLSAPAISRSQLFETNKKNGEANYRIIFVATLGTLFCAVLYFIHKKRKKGRLPDSDTSVLTLGKIQAGGAKRANSIFVFGDFTVNDRNGKDISYMFSHRLKQVFLLILQHSAANGIPSQQITNLLWSDRDNDKAKNIRGVTINNLRKILEELDGISLIYEKSYYKIVLQELCFCDCLKCLELFSKKEKDIDIPLFIEIVSRGTFLKDENDFIFDSFKSLMEQKIEPVIKRLIEESYLKKEYQTTILLCEAIFKIDPINESSISFLIRSMVHQNMQSEAKKRFFKFVVEYKKMIGEDYPKEFSDINI